MEVSGAPGTTRTFDPQLRKLMLYPTELRARGTWSLGAGAFWLLPRIPDPDPHCAGRGI
jgi:hypothetical protein